MGNSQTAQTSHTQYQYIQPRKIKDTHKDPIQDISDQIQNIFGISHIPVSHRAVAPESQYLQASIFKQLPVFQRQNPIDRQYQHRISHLQQQILTLKSIIQQSKSRSHRQSPIPSDSSQGEEQTNTIQQSRSRANYLTYFQSREYVRQ